jgi:hypothetical protein
MGARCRRLTQQQEEWRLLALLQQQLLALLGPLGVWL